MISFNKEGIHKPNLYWYLFLSNNLALFWSQGFFSLKWPWNQMWCIGTQICASWHKMIVVILLKHQLLISVWPLLCPGQGHGKKLPLYGPSPQYQLHIFGLVGETRAHGEMQSTETLRLWYKQNNFERNWVHKKIGLVECFRSVVVKITRPKGHVPRVMMQTILWHSFLFNHPNQISLFQTVSIIMKIGPFVYFVKHCFSPLLAICFYAWPPSPG